MSTRQVQTVSTRAEFEAVMDCQWIGFTSPVEPFWDGWFPTDIGSHMKGHSQPRPNAVAESKERMWTAHVANPASTWIYMPDQDGTVLACCQWRVYPALTNPYESGLPDTQCPAWPAGSAGGAFMAKLARALCTPRVAWMGRPHVGLSWMAVLPTARGRGLGSTLMRWGTDKADELGLESWVEASDLGKSLYRAHGFRVMRELNVDMSLSAKARAAITTTDSATSEVEDEWEALRTRYLPQGYHFHSMWRPVGGKWDEGAADQTWRERFEIWDAVQGSGGRYVVVIE